MTTTNKSFNSSKFIFSLLKVQLLFLFILSVRTHTIAQFQPSCDCIDTVDITIDTISGFTFISPFTVYDGDFNFCNIDSINISREFFDCSDIGNMFGVTVSTATFDSSGVIFGSCFSFVRVSGNCACWDLNSDGIAQVNEDVNGDGLIDNSDCVACWDLNGDGLAQINEDVDGDGVISNFDCCWDFNQDGYSNPMEDLNGDGVFDSGDCDDSLFVSIDTIFQSNNMLTFMDPCSCSDMQNCDVGGITYFHDVMTIPAAGSVAPPSLDIRVLSSTNFYIDVPCDGGSLSEPSYGLSAGTAMNEISPGVYELEFWRPSGLLPTFSITTVLGGGVITLTAPNATFEPVCFQEDCIVVEPIPTMGEWGLMCLGLLLLILGVVTIKQRELLKDQLAFK